MGAAAVILRAEQPAAASAAEKLENEGPRPGHPRQGERVLLSRLGKRERERERLGRGGRGEGKGGEKESGERDRDGEEKRERD